MKVESKYGQEGCDDPECTCYAAIGQGCDSCLNCGQDVNRHRRSCDDFLGIQDDPARQMSAQIIDIIRPELMDEEYYTMEDRVTEFVKSWIESGELT